jgi:hypothetical protein
MKRTLLAALRLASTLALVACGGANNTLGNHPSGDAGSANPDGSPAGGANLTASANPQSFGSVVVGQQGMPVRIDIINIGTAASGTLTTALTGDKSYAIDKDGCAGQTLAAQGQTGNKCTITMHFAPTVPGSPKATLKVSDSAGDSVSVDLTGTATALVDITLLPMTQDFGTVVASSTSMPVTFTLANNGMTDAGQVQISLAGTDAEQFTTSMDTCTGTDLKAGARCSIVVTFAPTTPGSKSATLTASLASAPTVTSTLTGTCASSATFEVWLKSSGPAVTSYDFMQVVDGTTAASDTQSFYLNNSGGVMSGVPKITITGPNSADFVLTKNLCTAALAPSQTCEFDIGFGPTAVATETATVTISAPGTTSTTLAIQGEGVKQAALASTPSTYNFGNVTQGQTSGAETFTIKNTGNVTTGPIGVSLTGNDPGEFQLGTDTCAGATLAGGATCTVQVTFAPDINASGGVRATLSIQATPGGSLPITLKGNAQTPASLSIGPTSHGFGSVAVGTQTSPFTFTVSNNGSLSSGPPKVTPGGTNKADFPIVADTCTGTPIPGNGTCTISVAFKPSTLAAESATFTVNASPGGSVTAKVSGTGASPASLQVTPNPGAFGPVVQGTQSPSKTFTVTNTGGVASGMVSVAIGGTNAADFHVVTF